MLKYFLLFFISVSMLQGQTLQENFFADDASLDQEVNAVFLSLSDEARVGQLLVEAVGRLGKPYDEVKARVEAGQVGGVLMLNGEKEEFKKWAIDLQQAAQTNGNLPLMLSADAEPSLINRKIAGSQPQEKTNTINTVERSSEAAKKIADDLNYIGIQYNYAPVCDLSPDNAAIGNRSYGSSIEDVTLLASAFIKTTQEERIVATAKHFPGHGLVKGDSHENLVFIDGPMEELAVYPTLIDQGVLSIMVGHIAVKNNKYETNGLPATCSRAIVTDLLKTDMGFKGIVITDAMNMGAVSTLKGAGLMALQAGCDIILMPVDVPTLIDEVIAEMKKNPQFKAQLYGSVKKVIRMKLLLNSAE